MVAGPPGDSIPGDSGRLVHRPKVTAAVVDFFTDDARRPLFPLPHDYDAVQRLRRLLAQAIPLPPAHPLSYLCPLTFVSSLSHGAAHIDYSRLDIFVSNEIRLVQKCVHHELRIKDAK